MDLQQLQYFRTIARTENISRAAELLYVAQPNLSVSITRLEQELGVALFERKRGKIKLTPTGRIFLSCADSVLDRLDEGIAETRRFEQAYNEQVRVASSIVDLMASLLADFLSDHPALSLRELSRRNDEIAACVLAGEADLGFCFGSVEQTNLEYIRLDGCERIVTLGRDHPLASCGLVSLRELDGQRFVCNLARDDRTLFDGLERTGRFRPQRIFECDDGRVELSMIISGGAMSITPVSHYLKLIKGDPTLPLTYLRVREQLPEACIGMVRPAGKLLSAASLQFYAMVSGFFENEHRLAADFEKTLPPR